MNPVKYSAPTNPFPKANGKWAVDHFPKGIRTEFGEYPDRERAQQAYQTVTSRWETNDPIYIVPSGIEG